MEPTVALDHEAGTLDVTGPDLPPVRLVRGSGTEASPHIPIGTRDAALLTLTVDGTPARIAPARGRLSRRSYRVDVTLDDGTAYRLVPCSYGESRLLRDGHRLGLLDSSGDGVVGAEWHEEVTPLDVAVGTTLAAAFGTGAQPWWQTALEFIGDLTP
ncbi:hypothetical protein ACFPM3_12405 [Streptomyces coeruleoprunus]|uniref:Uncharacterized protein n=1 Tax=Streptomyces coeruleoprunus TaxID=285563 RepID=A0ABV9XDE5_9ACTN